MKLGISSYSLTWSIGVPGYETPRTPLTAVSLLHVAKEHAIDLVQIADNIPLHQLDDNELALIKQTSDELNISIEVGTRGSAPEHLLRYLEIAKYFKSNIVRTLITAPEINDAERDIRRVLPQYIDAGVAIAIENHGLHTTRQLTGLFQRLNSPFVGSCLDTVNSFGALECPDQVIKELVPYIINLHIKDFEIKRHRHQMGFEITGTPAGSGRLDMEMLLGYINEYGKEPTAILELWTPFTDNVEDTISLENQWFEQSLDFLKQNPAFGSTRS